MNSLVEMKERAVYYFTDLFAATPRRPPIPNLNLIFNERPSEEENTKLRVYPTGEEIWKALRSMPNGKAPGIDGISSEIVTHIIGTQ